MKTTYSVFKKKLTDTTTKPPKRIALYLDLDGVFCDFNKRILSLYPEFVKVNGKYSDEMTREEKTYFLPRITAAILSHKSFWTTLEWCDGGKKLYNYIRRNKTKFSSISFLTAPWKSDPRCVLQKQEWVMKNFNLVSLDAFYSATDKWNYVGKQPGEIQLLIDDRDKNISLWETNGGVGILHTSADSSIDKLKILLE